jgi:RimJ/RimL family protein N-acetyltransferase
MELETERLKLRMWREEDFDVYAEFHADVEMAHFIGGACDRSTAWRRMACEVGHWTLRGYGFWALEEKASGNVVGSCGLWNPEGWPELEVGYWLTRPGQGKGYATEAARRSIEYAFGDLGVSTLISCIHLDNEASTGVARRLGAELEETIELHTFGPHGIWRYPGVPA